ncbi:hypothetical protein QYF36_007654 [Acer negundo]|nr:hypothetical protein QYF36_007654 [Acer negundo]
MQQRFERLFKVMGDVRDYLERHDEAISRLQGEPRCARQPAFVNDVYDGGEDTDDGQATIIGQDVNPKRQIRRGRFDGDEGADSRMNPFMERENDEDQQVDHHWTKEQASQDLIKVLKMQEESKMVNMFQASPNHEDKSPA